MYLLLLRVEVLTARAHKVVVLHLLQNIAVRAPCSGGWGRLTILLLRVKHGYDVLNDLVGHLGVTVLDGWPCRVVVGLRNVHVVDLFAE